MGQCVLVRSSDVNCKSFWANPGANLARDLPDTSKLALMQRVTLPQLSFRCSRWPPQRQIGSELDHLQQKMTASLMRLPRFPGEEVDVYVRRRGKAARKICSERELGPIIGSAGPWTGMNIWPDRVT